jgi:hypothetical protein
MPWRSTWLPGAALLLGFTACTDNTPLCMPMTAVECFCATGELGQQICRFDGQSYLACSCFADAGIDAAVADSDPPEGVAAMAIPTAAGLNATQRSCDAASDAR